jgi:hypothetical protein
VFQEGSDVMRRTNLFIKLEIRNHPTDLFHVLPEFGVPFFIPRREACLASLMQYKGFIMTYQIKYHGLGDRTNGLPDELLILDRHLDLLCAVLRYARWTNPHFPDKLLHHRIGICGPESFAGSDLFSTTEIRHMEYNLLSPFRRALGGVSSVEISGSISEELRAATIADISRAPTWDTNELLDTIRQMMQDGAQSLECKKHMNSYRMYGRGIFFVENLMTAKMASEIRASGGTAFRDNLLELHFSLNCGYLEAILDEMHFPDEDSIAPAMVRGIKKIIEGAWEFQNLHGQGSVWKPAPQQVAKLSYQLAVACRISLEIEWLETAESEIERAILATPSDLELLSEREKIAQWRASR